MNSIATDFGIITDLEIAGHTLFDRSVGENNKYFQRVTHSIDTAPFVHVEGGHGDYRLQIYVNEQNKLALSFRDAASQIFKIQIADQKFYKAVYAYRVQVAVHEQARRDFQSLKIDVSKYQSVESVRTALHTEGTKLFI